MLQNNHFKNEAIRMIRLVRERSSSSHLLLLPTNLAIVSTASASIPK
jgi:hypothetical protein